MGTAAEATSKTLITFDDVSEDQAPVTTWRLTDLDVEAGLVDAVKLDDLALNEEFTRIAADTAYWNTRAADAEFDHAKAELEKKRITAQKQLQYRAQADDDNRGLAKEDKVKVTEEYIASLVELDDAVYAAKVECLRADHRRSKIAGWTKALSVKRDMLIQHGARAREEMKGEPSLRSQAGGAAVLHRARRLGEEG